MRSCAPGNKRQICGGAPHNDDYIDIELYPESSSARLEIGVKTGGSIFRTLSEQKERVTTVKQITSGIAIVEERAPLPYGSYGTLARIATII